MSPQPQALWRRLAGPGAPLRRLARRLGLARLRPLVVKSAPPRVEPFDAATARPGAMLVGHPFGVLGVGEYVRASAAAFAAAGIPFHIRNTYDWGEHLADKHPDFPFWDRLATTSPYRVNVLHINADEMAEARRHLGDAFFAGRYNIAAWHWELSRFPEAWLPALQGVDELWASSRFIQQALSQQAKVPVLWMPHPVEVSGEPESGPGPLGLPEGRYLFLAFFDFTSFVARKNPRGAIRAFLNAFPPGSPERVGLVIKANGATVRPAEAKAFLAWPELRDPRIVVINETLDRRSLIGLMKRCDCFVSLHRSEGFGRGIAEALLLEKPVIVTGYSGNMDFTSPENACIVDYRLVDVGRDEYPHAAGQRWAEPDLEQAAGYMRRVVEEAVVGRHPRPPGTGGRRGAARSRGGGAALPGPAGRAGLPLGGRRLETQYGAATETLLRESTAEFQLKPSRRGLRALRSFRNRLRAAAIVNGVRLSVEERWPTTFDEKREALVTHVVELTVRDDEYATQEIVRSQGRITLEVEDRLREVLQVGHRRPPLADEGASIHLGVKEPHNARLTRSDR